MDTQTTKPSGKIKDGVKIQKITPFLWFDNQAEEAVNFYLKIFNNSKIKTIIELIPNKNLVYQVIDNQFSFTEDKSEWIDTKLIFTISGEGERLSCYSPTKVWSRITNATQSVTSPGPTTWF